MIFGKQVNDKIKQIKQPQSATGSVTPQTPLTPAAVTVAKDTKLVILSVL